MYLIFEQVRSDNDIKSILASAANRNGRLEISAGIVKNEERILGTALKLNSRNNSIEFSVTGAGKYLSTKNKKMYVNFFLDYFGKLGINKYLS